MFKKNRVGNIERFEIKFSFGDLILFCFDILIGTPIFIWAKGKKFIIVHFWRKKIKKLKKKRYKNNIVGEIK